MAEKFPLGHDVNFTEGKPFVGYNENGDPFIVVEEYLRNKYGDILYTEYRVLDYNPTKEEIFKVTLANPQDKKRVITGYTVTEIRRREEDN